MANNGTILTTPSVVREEDLEDLQELRRELQGRIDRARDDGRLFMMGQYVGLQATISQEVDRIERRFKRETIAANRREHKRLKAEARNATATNAAAPSGA